TFFINHSLHKLKNVFNQHFLKALRAFKWKYIFRSMNDVHEQSFANSKTVQLFNRYATYKGSDPYQAPAMLTMIPHLELTQGTFYP
ncbi:hypothetical protein ABTM90_20050, partial [Acinetobacter baumannii]